MRSEQWCGTKFSLAEGKTQTKERFLLPTPLNYTWNHSRCTSLSKFTTIGGEPVADHVRTW